MTRLATAVVIEPGIGEVPSPGSTTVFPTETTTYNLTATGSEGSLQRQATVTVVSPAPVIDLTVEPDEIVAGDTARLTWSTTLATTVTIDPGLGSVAATGSSPVAPAQTTTYTLRATGPGGTNEATATLTVAAPPEPEPPAAANADRITIIGGGTGTVVVRGAAGTVAALNTVRVSSLADGKRLETLADAVGAFEVTFEDSFGESFMVEVIGPGGLASTAVGVEAETLALMMLTPAAGARITTETLLVSGTVSGPASTGVTVNGRPAELLDGSWAIVVPVSAGENRFVARLGTLSGATREVERSVIAEVEPRARLTLEAMPASGLAPHTVELKVDASRSPGLEQVTVSFGDGSPPVAGSVSQSFAHTFTAAGLYPVFVDGVSRGGRTYHAETLVTVSNPAARDGMIRQLWDGLMRTLAAGELELAQRFLTLGAQERLGPVLEQLQPELATIAAELSSLTPLSGENAVVSNSYAEDAVAVEQEGEAVLYLVYFMPDENGVWKLESL